MKRGQLVLLPKAATKMSNLAVSPAHYLWLAPQKCYVHFCGGIVATRRVTAASFPGLPYSQHHLRSHPSRTVWWWICFTDTAVMVSKRSAKCAEITVLSPTSAVPKICKFTLTLIPRNWPNVHLSSPTQQRIQQQQRICSDVYFSFTFHCHSNGFKSQSKL